MNPFGAKLREAIARYGNLCVGIDPHAELLSAWGLPDTAAGAREFALRVVDAAAGRVAIVKPQVAFFERFGSAGFAVLEELFPAARAAGLLVLADVKRGDMGSTMDAYGDAWLAPGAPLEVDAMTANAYQGLGVMEGTLRSVRDAGKGVFVLAATSNPEGVITQSAQLTSGPNAGATVAEGIARDVTGWNLAHRVGATGTAEPWGSVGLVIGATLDWDAVGLSRAPREPLVPILAPGFGFQGVSAAEFRARYGSAAPHTLASESRSILQAGPAGIAEAIAGAAAAYSRA